MTSTFEENERGWGFQARLARLVSQSGATDLPDTVERVRSTITNARCLVGVVDLSCAVPILRSIRRDGIPYLATTMGEVAP